jgi:hypothetical protein
MIPADTNWAATSADGTSAQTEPVNVFVATKASSAVCASYNLLLLALAAMASLYAEEQTAPSIAFATLTLTGGIRQV